MAIKVDLEKAYDCLNWSFIQETLRDVDIPKNLVEVIYWCITSSRMQLLWNGSSSSKFTPSRGIYQGDPISRYIFVLCIEKLYQLIFWQSHIRFGNQLPLVGVVLRSLIFALLMT